MTLRARLRWMGLALIALVAGGSSSSASSVTNAVSSGSGLSVSRAHAGAVLGTIDGQPRLLVDGKPFFFFGGAFFYPRIAPERWRAEMEAMRSLGANTLDLYIPWNWHELSDGEFDFDGHTDARRNLREVLRLGAQLGFHFIIRPGPVIRNEWRNGGYPSWLLTRPEYDMPLHDILEGRYPATATLQNVHSDDAASEWLGNATHLRYSARWLARALGACKPYASRILAVQLDDDQGAYIDNQTYPAPHFREYLTWLNDRVHDTLGPRIPTFINTYQMRVPSSSPVWTMGNWYQSDAYTIGKHDRVDLDFSTLLLALSHRGPLAQSEFQAGWLAGPQDPDPRPADPRNTGVALAELLALGVQGVVDFPLQDTLAEPGWEAPFSNALYGWDAALGFATNRREDDFYPPGPTSRLQQTERFGIIVRALGPAVGRMHRVHDVAIAYAEPPPLRDGSPPPGAGEIVASVRATLATCIERGRTCDILDANADAASLRAYRSVVVSPALITLAPKAAASLITSARAAAVPVRSSLDSARGTGVTVLIGPLGTLSIAPNWNDRSAEVVFGTSRAIVAPHSVEFRISHLALSALGRAGDRRRISSDDCQLIPRRRSVFAAPEFSLSALPSHGCIAVASAGARSTRIRVPPGAYLSLPDLRLRGKLNQMLLTMYRPYAKTDLAPGAWLPFRPYHAIRRTQAVAELRDVLYDVGVPVIFMRNDRLRLVIDPQAGARAFSLQAGDRITPSEKAEVQVDDAGWSSPNAFDATGGWRDDVSAPIAPSPRDYIARFTHTYPTGTYNRKYSTQILATGTHASVRFSYEMPDVTPTGAIFERIVSIEPMNSRVVVDERLHWANDEGEAQQLIVRSSIPVLRRARGTMVDAPCVPLAGTPAICTLPAQQRSLAAYHDGFAFVVAWADGDVATASWTPYRSTGTLALTMTPGVWHRTVYAYAAEPSLDAARAFAQAERAWVSANPPPGR